MDANDNQWQHSVNGGETVNDALGAAMGVFSCAFRNKTAYANNNIHLMTAAGCSNRLNEDELFNPFANIDVDQHTRCINDNVNDIQQSESEQQSLLLSRPTRRTCSMPSPGAEFPRMTTCFSDMTTSNQCHSTFVDKSSAESDTPNPCVVASTDFPAECRRPEPVSFEVDVSEVSSSSRSSISSLSSSPSHQPPQSAFTEAEFLFPCCTCKCHVTSPANILADATANGTTKTNSAPERPIVQNAMLQRDQAAYKMEDIFGGLKFDPDQLLVFDKLGRMMILCCVMWVLLTLSDIISTVTWVLRLNDSVARQGVSYSNAAAVLQDGVIAFVIQSAATSFHNLRRKPNHLPYVLEGILQLSHLFLQLAFFVMSVSLIQLVEAALMWPAIKYCMYCAVTLAALARSLAVTYLHRKYRHNYLAVATDTRLGRMNGQSSTWMETLALVLSGSFLVPLRRAHGAAATAEGVPHHNRLRRACSLAEYEFSFWDEQILLAVINAMRICGSMSIMQAFVTCLLGAAQVHHGRFHKAISSVMDITGQLAMASTVFRAANAFQMIVTTKGRDVSNLLLAVGDNGLTNLFGRLSNIAASLVVVQTVEVGWRLYSSDLYSHWLTTPLVIALVLMVSAGVVVKIRMLKLPKQEQLRRFATRYRKISVQNLQAWALRKKSQ